MNLTDLTSRLCSRAPRRRSHGVFSSRQAQRASHTSDKSYPHPVEKLSALCITLVLLLPLDPITLTGPQRARIMLYQASRSAGLNTYQWRCLDAIIWKESNYRPNARTGSHWGISQIKNLGPKPIHIQIQRTLKYLKHRYNNNACKALAHHNHYNWW